VDLRRGDWREWRENPEKDELEILEPGINLINATIRKIKSEFKIVNLGEVIFFNIFVTLLL
jgi:hypothetical protein